MSLRANSPQCTDVLLLHGLNNSPRVFDDLRAWWESQGVRVHCPVWKGHESVRDTEHLGAAWFSLVGHDWVDQMGVIAEQLDRELRAQPDRKLVVVAFSLGALVYGIWRNQNQILQETSTLPVMKQVFLAPAFFPKASVLRTAIWLSRLNPKKRLRSSTPQSVRAHDFTTDAAYGALAHCVRRFRLQIRGQKKPAVFDIPTLLVIDPKDELIHAKKTKANLLAVCADWLELNCEKPKLPEKGFHHLIPVRWNVGEPEWEKLLGRIKQFIG